jgi:ATP/maltotriose-dependent transcriptional regulator MalT
MRNTIETAKDTIAKATERATRIIATAAADALKVKSAQQDGDHDIIVELRVRMEDLKNMVKDLTDGTTRQISEHEKRIGRLETARTTQTVMLSLGIALLVIIFGLLTYHLFGVKV